MILSLQKFSDPVSQILESTWLCQVKNQHYSLWSSVIYFIDASEIFLSCCVPYLQGYFFKSVAVINSGGRTPNIFTKNILVSEINSNSGFCVSIEDIFDVPIDNASLPYSRISQQYDLKSNCFRFQNYQILVKIIKGKLSRLLECRLLAGFSRWLEIWFWLS